MRRALSSRRAVAGSAGVRGGVGSPRSGRRRSSSAAGWGLLGELGVNQVQQTGQRRRPSCVAAVSSVDMGVHRGSCAQRLGAGLVGAQPVGGAVDADDDARCRSRSSMAAATGASPNAWPRRRCRHWS